MNSPISDPDPERNALRQQIALLALESQQKGSNTAWFEEVYTRASGDTRQVPWAKLTVHPLLEDWLTRHEIDGTGKTALVIGCGLGDDAETLASQGRSLGVANASPTPLSPISSPISSI
jgi:hypothetical protein